MPSKDELVRESALHVARTQELSAKWRARAYQLQADIKGSMHGARYRRPVGMEKARIGAQVSTLLTCMAELDALLEN